MKSNFKKFSSILIKGTFASTLVNSTTQIIGVILLPVFTYYLTPEDYGIVAIVSMVAVVLSHVTNSGILTATTRLYHDTEDINERKLLIGSANVYFLSVALIPVVIGLLFGPKLFSWIFKDFSFYPYGFLALILTFIRQPARIWITLMNLQYKFHQATIYNGISLIIGIAVSVILVVVFEMGAMGKVLGMFPSAIILVLISLITVHRYTNGLWSFQNIKKQFLLGLPILGALWSTQILELGGAYMLERFSNMNSVGVFALAMSLAQLPLVLIYGFRQMWNPVIYDNMNNKNYETISKLTYYFVGILTLINILILLFGKEAILIIVNERFYDAIPLIGFLILGVYFNGLITISNSLLGYNKKFSTISTFALIGSALYVIMCIFLIPRIGALGAAISFAVSYFVFFNMGVIHERKIILKIIKNLSILIPIILLIFLNLVTYLLSFYFPYDELNIIEILLKLTLLIISLFLFIKFKIFLVKDIINGYNLVVQKVKKKINK